MLTGTIKGFSGLGASVAFIRIDDKDVLIETNSALRAIESAFGCIGNAVGKKIYYTMDNQGVLEAFEPMDEDG